MIGRFTWREETAMISIEMAVELNTIKNQVLSYRFSDLTGSSGLSSPKGFESSARELEKGVAAQIRPQ